MPNTFLNLEIPRGDGVGDPSDTGLTAATKTFIYPGTPAGRFAVEGSHDGHTWAVVIGRERAQQAFFSGNRSQVLTVDAVVKQLRVRATGTRGVACPEGIGLGAPPAAGKNVFAQLPVPKDGDRGDPFDLGPKTGLLKTFILGEGAQSSTGFSVLASVDGERFGEVLRLQGGTRTVCEPIAAVCRFPAHRPDRPGGLPPHHGRGRGSGGGAVRRRREQWRRHRADHPVRRARGRDLLRVRRGGPTGVLRSPGRPVLASRNRSNALGILRDRRR